MPSLDINDEAMMAVISKAVLQSITKERQEELLTKAVTSLLQAPREAGSRYGHRNKTVLQECFDDAAREVARKKCVEHLNKPDQLDKIERLVSDAAQKALGLHVRAECDDPDGKEGESSVRSKLVEEMADGMRKGLFGDRY